MSEIKTAMDDFELPEKAERAGRDKERVAGLIISVIAMMLAIITGLAHETHNDEILAHVDAADQYSFYQAKRERRAQLELSLQNMALGTDRLSSADQAASTKLTAAYNAEIKHLDGEGKEIMAKGDALIRDSRRLAQKARLLDLGEIGLQISVVLCSTSILTEQRLFLYLGLALAAAGMLVAIGGLFL